MPIDTAPTTPACDSDAVRTLQSGPGSRCTRFPAFAHFVIAPRKHHMHAAAYMHLFMRSCVGAGFFALSAVGSPSSSLAATLKINGSTTVNLPVAEAAEILRAEQK